MSLLARPIFYLWTFASGVARLERLYPTYELLAEQSELPNWDNAADVVRTCKALMRHEKQHGLASFFSYRRMFVRIEASYERANPAAAGSLVKAMARIGALYVEVAGADDLGTRPLPVTADERSWPLAIHYAASYWWP